MMSSVKLKGLALSAVAIASLAASRADAATTINVAVAANFTATMNALIAAFKVVNPGTNITFTSDSSSVLQNQIINGARKYDLFLSADKTRPQQLYATYPALITGLPFKYAVGELELWSPKVNISAGLPATLTQDVVLANPATAPYGTAAAQVLSAKPWQIPWPSSPYPPVGTAHVFVKNNISTTYTSVKNGTFPMGFIAQSSICRVVNGVKRFNSGFHHTYPYNVAPKHSRIEQYAIMLKNFSRTTAQSNLMRDFVRFMRTSPVGKSIITSYCYSLT
jgi:molybdate transport system substrate-binding protein